MSRHALTTALLACALLGTAACSDDAAPTPKDSGRLDGVVVRDQGPPRDGAPVDGPATQKDGPVVGDLPVGPDLPAGANLAPSATVTVSFNDQLLAFLTDGVYEGDKPNCDLYYYWFSKFPKGQDKWIELAWASPVTVGAVAIDTVPKTGPLHPNCMQTDAGRTFGDQPLKIQVVAAGGGSGQWTDVAAISGKTGDWTATFTPQSISKLRLLTEGAVALTTNPIVFEVGVYAQ